MQESTIPRSRRTEPARLLGGLQEEINFLQLEVESLEDQLRDSESVNCLLTNELKACRELLEEKGIALPDSDASSSLPGNLEHINEHSVRSIKSGEVANPPLKVKMLNRYDQGMSRYHSAASELSIHNSARKTSHPQEIRLRDPIQRMSSLSQMTSASTPTSSPRVTKIKRRSHMEYTPWAKESPKSIWEPSSSTPSSTRHRSGNSAPPPPTARGQSGAPGGEGALSRAPEEMEEEVEQEDGAGAGAGSGSGAGSGGGGTMGRGRWEKSLKAEAEQQSKNGQKSRLALWRDTTKGMLAFKKKSGQQPRTFNFSSRSGGPLGGPKAQAPARAKSMKDGGSRGKRTSISILADAEEDLDLAEEISVPIDLDSVKNEHSNLRTNNDDILWAYERLENIRSTVVVQTRGERLWKMLNSTIDPTSPWRVGWDILMMLFLFYITLVLPYRIAFFTEPEVYGSVWYWEVMVDGMFGVDILINFRTGYAEDGKLITDERKIASKYITSWLAIDVLSIFPFDTFSNQEGVLANFLKSLRLVKLSRMLKLLKMVKLMRLMKMPFLLAKLEVYVNRAVLHIVKFLFMVLVIDHLMACLYCFIATLDESGDNWFRANLLEDSSDYSKYVAAIYWSMSTMTTVGYGDIVPHSDMERIVTTGIVMVSATLYAYFMGNINVMVASLNINSTRKSQQLELIDTFLKKNDVPQHIGDRVRNYYDYLWQREIHMNERSIVDGLSSSLRSELVLHIYRNMVEKVPLFQNKHPSFITGVVLCLKLEVYAPGDNIVAAGEAGMNMYFIMSGKVAVQTNQAARARESQTSFTSEDFDEIIVDTLLPGQHFGEVSVLTGQRRTANVIAITYCELYSLSRKDMLDVLDDWPELSDEFELLGEAKPMDELKLVPTSALDVPIVTSRHFDQSGSHLGISQPPTVVSNDSVPLPEGTPRDFTSSESPLDQPGPRTNSIPRFQSVVRSKIQTHIIAQKSAAGSPSATSLRQGSTPSRKVSYQDKSNHDSDLSKRNPE